ncbi:hypothetical protein KP509_07G018300 [Ceratopteris richardii]|nr:hypothetical protein KP509_07G018300 [Ceratopteris richardii]
MTKVSSERIFSCVFVLMAVLLACIPSSSCVSGFISCDRNRSGLLRQDCVTAIGMLTEDAFTLMPGHFMQEVFGSCKARVFNNGGETKNFYRDTVTLEFQDILLECVSYNSHPGALLSGSDILYSITFNSNPREN